MNETTTRKEWANGGTNYVMYFDSEDRPHREDGPAVTKTWSDGYQYYACYWHDKLHRKGSPAVTKTRSGDTRSEAWYWHGTRHRKDGPAVTTTLPDGTRHMQWWEDDKLHRKDGPAVITMYSDGSRREEWWEDGKFIREERTPHMTETTTRKEWKQERDEAVGHLREVVRTYRNADSDGVLAYSDVLGGAIDTAAAWLDAHKAADVTETPTRREWTTNGVHGIEYRDAKGRLHREDGPADSETWTGGYRYEAWHWHDKLHRIGGPAVTTMYRNGTRHEEWWEDDKFIREEVTQKTCG